MQLTWWLWVVVGIVTLLAEILTPGGFYLMFIGLAAITVGVASPVISSSWIEITLFAVLSVLYIGLFRKPLVRKVKISTPSSDVPEFVGEAATALATIAPNAEGQVELRGSTWKAINISTTPIPANTICTVQARNGLTFSIIPKP